MEEKSKTLKEISKKKAIVGGAAILLLVALFFGLRLDEGNKQNSSSTYVSKTDFETDLDSKEGFKTWDKPPTNVTIPEVNSNAPAEVAKPLSVTSASPGSSASQRSFSISIANDKFEPSTIIAKLKDNITITFTAVDKNYYFTQPDYGFDELIPKGMTKKIGLQLSAPGKFLFYCSGCGGPQDGPVGYLIVVE